jgi:hypothetical protein
MAIWLPLLRTRYCQVQSITKYEEGPKMQSLVRMITKKAAPYARPLVEYGLVESRCSNSDSGSSSN